jgi:hypothetical protein
MPHLLPTTARRSTSAFTLPKTEIALAKRHDDVDALLGEIETIDLLPLSTLVALTGRARAA